MAKSMFTDNDSSTELAWKVLKKEQACWHTDYCTVSCEECENYVTHRDLEKAIDIIIEENKSNKKVVIDELEEAYDDLYEAKTEYESGLRDGIYAAMIRVEELPFWEGD